MRRLAAITLVAASIGGVEPAGGDVLPAGPGEPSFATRIPDQPAIAAATAIAAAPDGRIWTAGQASGDLLGWDPSAPDDEAREKAVGVGVVDDVKVAPDGELIVLRDFPPRVFRLKPSGELVAAWGEIGTGPGQFGVDTRTRSGPGGIAVDPRNGEVLVVDTLNSRIQRFGRDGRFVASWEVPREPGDSGPVTPRSAAIAADGDVFVLGSIFLDHTQRVQRFDASGTLRDSWEVPRPDGLGAGQLELDPEGDVWLGSERGWIGEFRNDGSRVALWQDFDLGEPVRTQPGEFTIARDGGVYVVDGGPSFAGDHRVLRVRDNGEVVATYGTSGRGNTRFAFPRGAAVDPRTGVLHVIDALGTIRQFDSEGRFIRRFGSLGSGDGQFGFDTSGPSGSIRSVGMAVDGATGDLYVIDMGNTRIQKFDARGRFLLAFGRQGDGPGDLFEPVGIAVSPTGVVHVVDRARGDIQRFAPDGRLLGAVVDLFELDLPSSIAFQPDGNLLVGVSSFPPECPEDPSTTGFGLAELTPEGECVGELRTGPGLPQDVEVGTTGDRYVIFANSDVGILRRGHDDGFVPWSRGGALAGEQRRPVALALDHERRRLWVVDSTLQRVQAFRTPDTTPPTISLRSPVDGAVFTLNQAVASDFSCEDDEALADCRALQGPEEPGAPLDTSRIGRGFVFRVVARDRAGNRAAVAAAYDVVYDFSGFLRPMAEPPAPTVATAGRVLPVRFRLPGFVPTRSSYGLGAVTPGYPRSAEVPCEGARNAEPGAGEPTVPADGETVTYEDESETLVHEWRTERSWEGTCRQLVLGLQDGTFHRALVRFRPRKAQR